MGIKKLLKSVLPAQVRELIYVKFFEHIDLENAYEEQFFKDNYLDSNPQAQWLAPRIIEHLKVSSVIDIGSGSGCWVDAFLKNDVYALGIEGSENAKNHLVCPIQNIYFQDLRKKLNISELPKSEFDLAISIEVAEHIERRYANIYLENITRFKPKHIIFSAAPPGQGGHAHVNLQPKIYWERKFLSLGYSTDELLFNYINNSVEQGRLIKDPPRRLTKEGTPHPGVWFPEWMPTNLMTFTKST